MIINRLVSLVLLIGLGIPILVFILIANWETKQSGLFSQERVGLHGKPFNIFKIRTLKGTFNSSVTDSSMKRTLSGRFLRKYHLDELPQLWNILIGDMNFVGPRPDTPEMYQLLSNEDFKILTSIRPGLMGPQQLNSLDEETILSQKQNAAQFYKEELWPKKVQENIQYIKNPYKKSDLSIIFTTLYKLVS